MTSIQNTMIDNRHIIQAIEEELCPVGPFDCFVLCAEPEETTVSLRWTRKSGEKMTLLFRGVMSVSFQYLTGHWDFSGISRIALDENAPNIVYIKFGSPCCPDVDVRFCFSSLSLKSATADATKPVATTPLKLAFQEGT